MGALGSVQGAWRVFSFRGRSRADSACRTDDLGLDLLQGTQSQAVLLTAAQAPHSNGRAWSSQRRALCCSVVCSLCLVCRGSGTQVNKATANGSMDSCRGDTPGAYNPNSPLISAPAAAGGPGTARPAVLAAFHLEQALPLGPRCSLECGAGDSQRGGHLLSPAAHRPSRSAASGRCGDSPCWWVPFPVLLPSGGSVSRVPVCVSTFGEPSLRHWVR